MVFCQRLHGRDGLARLVEALLHLPHLIVNVADPIERHTDARLPRDPVGCIPPIEPADGDDPGVVDGDRRQQMVGRGRRRERTPIVVHNDRRRPGLTPVRGVAQQNVGPAESRVGPDRIDAIAEYAHGRIRSNGRNVD